MLATPLVISVDTINDDTPEDVVFNKHNLYENRSSYIGPSHSSVSRQLLEFYRTEPTKSGNFRGVSKSAIKLTTDISVEGVDTATTLTAPAIVKISFSHPVGMTVADEQLMRQTLIALLDDDDFMLQTCDLLEI